MTAVATCCFFGRPLSAQDAITSRLFDVVRYNAPAIIAEVQTQYCSTRPNQNCAPNLNLARQTDHLLPVDFDYDHLGNNSVSHLLAAYVPDARPVVYYSIEETGMDDSEGFFYIGYYFYHAQDGGAYIAGQFVDRGHEHDMEGIFMVVQKQPYLPYGRPILAMTEAHGALLPFGVPGQIDFNQTLTTGGVGSWRGQVEFWYDSYFGVSRPVVAIRSGTHGTYMAQDCSANSGSYYWDGFGVDLANTGPGVFSACIHSGTALSLLVPSAYDPGVTDMPANASNGTWSYRLEEVAQSPLWAERTNSHVLLGGTNTLSLGYGLFAQDIFEPANYTESTANPPWAWLGGPGSNGGIPGHSGYWYSFAMDGTFDVHHDPGQWSQIPVSSLIIDSGRAAYAYFQNYQNANGSAWANFLSLPVVHNGFHTTYPPQPLTVAIEGTDYPPVGQLTTWDSQISGGRAPYTLQWSGDPQFYGSQPSISATFSDSSPHYLFLDVWDALGAHIAVSKSLTVCTPQPVCPT